MSTSTSSSADGPEQYVAYGDFSFPSTPSGYRFVFSTALHTPCPPAEPDKPPGKKIEGDGFINKVKVRKWTDTYGNQANTPPPDPDPFELPQPERGCLVNIGDVLLDVGLGKDLVFKDCQLDGTQTYGAEKEGNEFYAVFLFTVQGKTDGTSLTGVGKVLERLRTPWITPPRVGDPPAARPQLYGAPEVIWWQCVLTVCPTT